MNRKMKKIYWVSCILIAILIVGITLIAFQPSNKIRNLNVNNVSHFSSLEEIEKYVNESKIEGQDYYRGGEMQTFATGVVAPANMKGAESADSSGAGASDYSQTNIQVEGVDEADIVKNDGKYLYLVTNGKISILEAYPAEEMKILSTINTSNYISNIFVNGDNLIAYSNSYEYIQTADCPQPLNDEKIATAGVGGIVAPDYYPRPCGYSKDITNVYVYDISNRNEPELKYNVSIDGNYVDSRMIGDYVYTITTKYINTYYGVDLPVYRINEDLITTQPSDVQYFDEPDQDHVFTSVSALNLKKGDFSREVFLTGYSGIIYVSENNIYLTNTKWVSAKYSLDTFVNEVALPLLPEEKDSEVNEIMASKYFPSWQKREAISNLIYSYSSSLEDNDKSEFDKNFEKLIEDYQIKINRESQKTEIHKISINKDEINYEGAGEVLGTLVNQFSMDEYKDEFRIATTTGDVWNGQSLNHLFVLDKNLDVIGSVEDMAKGERIYSVRFMGERAYIVTFKKVDPLFVIDLSDGSNPRILGELKITGFSDYLHPYDETHIIGVGKEAQGGGENFAWYQGVKISLFDVSDVANPKEVAKIVIGDRGTQSAALYDHKAFLFDKEKNLLVLPIDLAEINESKKQYPGSDPNSIYGEQVWQGAYVLNIDLDEISVRGKITHRNENDKTCYDNWVGSKYCYFDGTSNIRRSLFMDNVLYTISDSHVQAHDLTTVTEISDIKLPKQEQIVYDGYTYAEGGSGVASATMVK
ncbi:MAG: beta-propeller domain-containing protein [Nanoarchaeota archaeon]|nr:beta-propeller domain-containing protein [Nanoarchaeota archaeon]